MNMEQSLRSIQTFKRDISKQINALKTTHNARKLTAKVNAKRRTLEMKVKKEVQSEIKKANLYLEARKRELNDFQKKVNSLVKRKIKKNGKRYS